jgi:bifunctional UDP-N-acetylglucosamine pyrophosphorylase/glucosamine-1-phosphate N-acetyltransferase
MSMETQISVVILAAGLGTRMKSKKTKVLHRAGGVPLIQHVVETALSAAPTDRIFVVVGLQAEQVQAAVQDRGVGFVLQPEQRGTGDALLACRERLSGQHGLIVVLYGDAPLLSQATVGELIRRQQASSAAATVITTVLEDPAGYGRVLRDQDGFVRAIVEQKAASAEDLAVREINSGIYCFRSELLWPYLERIEPNAASGEYYLTDIVESLRQDGHVVQPFRLEDATEVLGINTRIELAEVDRHFRDRKVRELMLAGVTIERPETVTVDARVAVGIDTVIEPFAQILGATTIGEDCRIGAGSIVRDSTLADRVDIEPFTIVGSSQIEAGARIGPYARLRMGNRIGAGAHVGNFVELKKTTLGAGSKSNHLAYLGDAVIGERVNIGAGTITCNYDGVSKHQTRIGDGAFIGSNATLVAPVEVGPRSYVAAGSTITDPVPPDALALGRARQVVKEEWARKRKEKLCGSDT